MLNPLKKDAAKWKVGVADNSTTAKLLDEADIEMCKVCGGKGHVYWECATKRKLDAFAKANNDTANWGAWKWKEYYKDLSERERDENRQKARFGLKRNRTMAGLDVSVSPAG